MFEKKFDREDMDADVEALKDILPEADLRRLGIIGSPKDGALGAPVRRAGTLHEGVMNALVMTPMNPVGDVATMRGIGAVIPNYGSKYSDAEVFFNFRSRAHAEILYNWITENGLLAPGEVSLIIEGIEYVVHVMPHVWITKPEVFQAIMIAYHDLLDDNLHTARTFEAFCEELGRVVTEKAERKGKGAEFGIHGNPYHDAESGHFATKSKLASDGAGSRSKVHIKKKVQGKGESLKFVFTKNPCGRDARLAGKPTRCWDGGEPGWWRGEQLAQSLSAALNGRPLPEGAQNVIDDYITGD